ncbi:MAG: crossover junction endodeoxyribonuclease RuvC [candidate division WOR-3 bacterium]|nr:MAG: crossover junction endodeoxyribonuclease RuvC [candidate division WOR-3 bacterium]
MKLIGIDPGITATGYSIIDENNCITGGTIRPKQKDTYKKIVEICQCVQSLVSEHDPDYVALEKVFHHKNVQSLIRSAELRGAIIMTILSCGKDIVEYTPAQIKLTTTGNGRASKTQVRYFIEKAIMTDHNRLSSHAIDAVAIAYTATRKMGRDPRHSLQR